MPGEWQPGLNLLQPLLLAPPPDALPVPCALSTGYPRPGDSHSPVACRLLQGHLALGCVPRVGLVTGWGLEGALRWRRKEQLESRQSAGDPVGAWTCWDNTATCHISQLAAQHQV